MDLNYVEQNIEKDIDKKELKELQEILDYDEPLEQPGKIYPAEVHGSAQRLLKIIRINKYVKFCKDCQLPSETTGLVVPYSCLDNTKDFGLGIFLYFYYIKFCIVVTFICIFLSSIPTIVFSERYTDHLINYCSEYYHDANVKNFTPRYQYLNTTNEDCLKYTKLSNNTSVDLDTITRADWMIQMSADNINEYYNNYVYKNNNENAVNEKNKKSVISGILIDYSILYFITGIILLLVNFLFIHYINLLDEAENFQETSPADYTILLHFYEKPPDNTSMTDYLLSLIKSISKNYVPLEVHQIIPCLKLGELYKLAKKVFEDKTKLYHVYNFKPQIVLNQEEKGIYVYDEKKNKKSNSNELNTLGINRDSGGTENSSVERHLNYVNDKDLYYFEKKCFMTEKTPIKEIKARIEYNQKEISLKEKEITETPDKYNGGTFFVVFKYIAMRDKFYDFFPTSFVTKSFWHIKYFFQNILFSKFVNEDTKKINEIKRFFQVEHATESYEVLWENMGYSFKQKSIHLLISCVITIILLAVSLGIVTLLNWLQSHLTDKGISGNKVVRYILSLLISIVIAVLNKVGKIALEIITKKFEKIETKTDYYISLSTKYAFFTFFNTGLVPVIACAIRNNWDEKDILLNNLLMIFIIDVIVPPLIFYFGPGLCIKVVKRAKARLDLEGVRLKDSTYTQGELNETFENPAMDLCYKYSYIVNVIALSLFFMPIFPVGMLFGFVALILCYFLEIFYLGFYKRPELLNAKLCKFFIQNFKIILLSFYIGDMIFLGTLDLHKTWAIVNLVIFIVIAFIPYQSIKLNLIGITEGEAKKSTYEENLLLFTTDYAKQNPLTRKKAMIEYFTKIRDKNIIDAQQCDELIEEIKNENIIDDYYKTSKNIDNILSSYTLKRQLIFARKKALFNKIKKDKNFLQKSLAKSAISGNSDKNKFKTNSIQPFNIGNNTAPEDTKPLADSTKSNDIKNKVSQFFVNLLEDKDEKNQLDNNQNLEIIPEDQKEEIIRDNYEDLKNAWMKSKKKSKKNKGSDFLRKSYMRTFKRSYMNPDSDEDDSSDNEGNNDYNRMKFQNDIRQSININDYIKNKMFEKQKLEASYNNNYAKYNNNRSILPKKNYDENSKLKNFMPQDTSNLYSPVNSNIIPKNNEMVPKDALTNSQVRNSQMSSLPPIHHSKIVMPNENDVVLPLDDNQPEIPLPDNNFEIPINNINNNAIDPRTKNLSVIESVNKENSFSSGSIRKSEGLNPDLLAGMEPLEYDDNNINSNRFNHQNQYSSENQLMQNNFGKNMIDNNISDDNINNNDINNNDFNNNDFNNNDFNNDINNDINNQLINSPNININTNINHLNVSSPILDISSVKAAKKPPIPEDTDSNLIDSNKNNEMNEESLVFRPSDNVLSNINRTSNNINDNNMNITNNNRRSYPEDG